MEEEEEQDTAAADSENLSYQEASLNILIMAITLKMYICNNTLKNIKALDVLSFDI